MKLILLLLISCLALQNGKGAPRTAVYKFVRCNPEGDQANCVTQQGPEMPWSSDLPSKLPASTAQYLEAEPEEDESPLGEDEVEEEEESPMMNEEGDPLGIFQSEEASGYEGSAVEGPYYAGWATPAESDTGSGEAWADIVQLKGQNVRSMRKLFPSSHTTGEVKPTEKDLEEDHLLKL
ncbi:unnamed protein product [Menidia menidia]|uniref:(Atlantic silverside) hypothetical protein n=1 Tax=Menidia menidia TaxID=238744 RepID=A0A8S4A6C7_9TELE|nr:unnamed protein product [Menidia menidia]